MLEFIFFFPIFFEHIVQLICSCVRIQFYSLSFLDKISHRIFAGTVFRVNSYFIRMAAKIVFAVKEILRARCLNCKGPLSGSAGEERQSIRKIRPSRSGELRGRNVSGDQGTGDQSDFSANASLLSAHNDARATVPAR